MCSALQAWPCCATNADTDTWLFVMQIRDLKAKVDHYRRTAPAQLPLPDSNELVAALDDLVEQIDRQEQDAEIRHPRPLRHNLFPSLLPAARRL